MKTATKTTIARTPIIQEDIRESDAEVLFLISEESPLLLTSFLLTSIDSFSSFIAYLQTHAHNVPIIVIFDVLSPVIEIEADCVVVRFVILVVCVYNLGCVKAVECTLIFLFPVVCIIFLQRW